MRAKGKVGSGGTRSASEEQGHASPAPPRFDTRTFKTELTPTWLAMATVLAGQRPPHLADGFRAIYLGGGHSFTAAVAAAVHPEAQIWWWDPDVRAVESARRLTEAAGLTNLTVHERPDLPDDLRGGPVDVVVLDGLLDTVGDELRARVFDLLGSGLRPGGIACVGYRTVVGWTEVAPVHRLVGHLVGRDPRPALEAVVDVKQTLRDLRAGGAGYLSLRPVVSAWLDEILDLPGEAFVEHLVRRDLRPLSHAGLTAALHRQGAEHIGPARAVDLPAPDIPAALLEVISDAPSLVAREAFTDLALRRAHRADLFRMGADPLATRERNRAVGALEVVAVPGPAPMPDRASRNTPKAAVRRALAEGPVAVDRLHDDRHHAESLVRRLLADGFVHPVHPHAAQLDPVATEAAARVSAVLTKPPVPPTERALVAPAVGSAVAASLASDPAQRATLGIR